MRLTAPPGAGMAVSLRNRVALKILRASVEGFRPWRTGFTPPASACFEHCSLSTTSVDHRGPPSMPRAELGIHGLKARTATGLEKSEKRGVQAARNGPSPPPTPAGGPVAKAEMSTADRLGSRDLHGAARGGPMRHRRLDAPYPLPDGHQQQCLRSPRFPRVRPISQVWCSRNSLRNHDFRPVSLS